MKKKGAERNLRAALAENRDEVLAEVGFILNLLNTGGCSSVPRAHVGSYVETASVSPWIRRVSDDVADELGCAAADLSAGEWASAQPRIEELHRILSAI